MPARWVPKKLIEEHKIKREESAREFLCRYEKEGEEFLVSIPKKFKTVKSAGKVMATVFWDKKGALLVDFMPKGTTINSERYCETLKKLRERFNKARTINELERSGRPRVQRTQAAIKAICERIRRNTRRKQNILAKQMNLAPPTVSRIINEDLGLRAFKRRTDASDSSLFISDSNLKKCLPSSSEKTTTLPPLGTLKLTKKSIQYRGTFESPKFTPLVILELLASLYDSSPEDIEIKLNQFITNLLNAERSVIFRYEKNKGYLKTSVFGTSYLDEPLTLDIRQLKFEEFVTYHTDDISTKYRKLFGIINKHTVESFLGLPIFDHKNSKEIRFFVCCINKIGNLKKECKPIPFEPIYEEGYVEFNNDDEAIINDIFKFSSTILYRCHMIIEEQSITRKFDTLLKITDNLARLIEKPSMLLDEVTLQARKLLGAERCSIFKVDRRRKQLSIQLLEGAEDKQNEIRMPLNKGVAGFVARTGQVINIQDPYSHPLFYKTIDILTNFKTNNILCFPIKNTKGKVICVAQLCNKIGKYGFTVEDEELAAVFSKYTSKSIVQAFKWKKLREEYFRHQLSNEQLLYYMTREEQDANVMINERIRDLEEFDPTFAHFSYNPRSLPYPQTEYAVISMIDRMGYIKRFSLPHDNLCRFILLVKRGYRDPAYHNWGHGFSVAHFAFLLIRNVNLELFVTPFECLIFFISCLCHDIDHRGTTNNFQVLSKSALGNLYSTKGSVMERHHFHQTLGILNLEECNPFIKLPKSKYRRFLEVMEVLILATDLARHFSNMKLYNSLVGRFTKVNDEDRLHLLQLLITSADLSDQTKRWDAIKLAVKCIYTEFFSQGDLEKKLGHSPIEMMDRSKAFIPNQQIGFLKFVIYPLYVLLHKMFPEILVVMRAIENTIAIWVQMKKICEREEFKNLTDPLLLVEQENIVQEIDAWVDKNIIY
ncbi:PDE2A [Cordylochernes scorpioides]|uniref:Phosphodiesterase n=1 Tax=Cordylochernes scorpioides TaxID=51811 RepID=A0ABY6K7T1_9ARAC|nr:PDE2A [Cordylochernes scorpioides]